MKKISVLIMLCLLCVNTDVNADAWKSETMKRMTKYLPNVQEWAIVANTANVLWHVGQLARTTLQLVRSYQASYASLVQLGDAIDQAWENFSTIFNHFDPYNMDTWAFTVRRAQNVLLYDVGDILWAFNNAEFVMPAVYYGLAVDDQFFAESRTRRNREIVNKYYKNRNLDSLTEVFSRVVSQYNQTSFQTREARLAELRAQHAAACAAGNVQECEKLQAEIDFLEADIAAQRDRTFQMFASSHEDSLINFTTDLITANLGDMQLIEANMAFLEALTNDLVDQYYALQYGTASIAGRKKDPGEFIVEGDRDPNTMGSRSNPPNKETAVFYDAQAGTANSNRAGDGPLTKPKETYIGKMMGQSLTYHDLAHLQNAIDFVLWKQEITDRDLAVLKAKSMTMIATMEAYDRQKTEMIALMQVNDFLDAWLVVDSLVRVEDIR